MAVVLPDAAGAVRIEHRGSLNGLPYANIFHVQGQLGNYVQADMNAVATAMHTAYFNAFIPLLNTATTLVSTTAIDLTSRQGYVGVESTPHNGTVAAPTAPPNSLAVCISWEIRDRYRGGHPRMYIPARQTSDIVAGKSMSATTQQLYESAALAYLAAAAAMTVGGQAWLPICVRYWSHHQLLAVPLQRHIDDAKVGTRYDSQRRRMGKETGI